MDRRQLVAWLPVGMASLLCPTCLFARPKARGCVRGATQGATSLPAKLSSSGRSDVDDVCLKEVDNLNRIFEVRAAFGFYDDFDGANALAFDHAYDSAYPDGTILFGKRLISNLLREGFSRFALVGVMGHEWGHVRQFRSAMKASWDVHYELSADYLSGWYLSQQAPVTDETRDAAMRAFQTLGDTDYTREDHHGTPSQRSKMFSFAYKADEGTSTNQEKAKDALQTSLSFFN